MRASAGKYNILLASLVVVVTAVIISVVFYQSYSVKLKKYNALSNKLNSESKRFTKLDDMSLLAAEYAEKFNQYMPVERYENENRLYWLDSLEKIRLKYKIPRLKYSIGVRKPYTYNDGVIKDKGLAVYISNIKLSMGLMHEADLISVINSIKSIKDSIHVVSSCQLKRTATGAGMSSVHANIEAICNVKWFTFKVS